MFIESKQLFHWRRTFHKGREVARCTRIIAGFMMFAAATTLTHAAPTGGVVDAGSADITLGTDTVIDQYSRRVDIDWTGFDTTSDESVTFNQDHGAASVAINRISGARTQFDGTLNANGQIFLINQNGITFGSTAQINVGSLLATTADTDRMDDELLNAQHEGGNSYNFDHSGNASIINQGDITVSNGGFAVLAAPRVENHGYIRADLGQIELVSTRQFRLNADFRGDGLITFEVPQEAFPCEEHDAGCPLGVENGATGVLQARSGHVYLTTARFAGEVVQGVINLSGVVDADQFVDNGAGGIEMIASDYGDSHEYPGGEIVVVSAGDINIGGGADIHAIGGEEVRAQFRAEGDITMGAEGDPASITLHADSDSADRYDDHAGTADYYGYPGGDAVAEADLVMIAGGSLDIADGVIEVTAAAGAQDPVYDYDAGVTGDYGHDSERNARARATAFLQGEDVSINADITVAADAQAVAQDDYVHDIDSAGTATCYACDEHGTDGAEAVAVLDVFATGDDGDAGDLTLQGDISVTADARSDDSRTARATANTVLAATGNLDVEGDIEVNAVAIAEPSADPLPVSADYGCAGYDCYERDEAGADANAALVMLGGAPRQLLEPLGHLSRKAGRDGDALSDILTLTDIHGLLDAFDGLEDPEDLAGGFGSGDVSYRGDINVTSYAAFDTTGTVQSRNEGQAQATSAAIIAGGGDVFIDTDPVRTDAQAYANYDDYGYDGYYRRTDGYYDAEDGYVTTEARSFLVMAAGLGDATGDGYSGGTDRGDLTILGDVSATAREQLTLNGQPVTHSGNPLTGALTALLAAGDITVRGADPLAEAGVLSDTDRTARVQGRTSMWQACDDYGCNPVVDGTDGLDGFIQGGTDTRLAQLIIEAGGDIDIQPKSQPKIQPVGLFLDPVGPGWPGDRPLRFDASGQMLVATGADATRPPRIAALPGDIEAAILAGGDPSTLLPPTASGGCVAAGRDAYTVTEADFFDRLISSSCESAPEEKQR